MTANKKILYQACQHFVDERLKTITQVMDANKTALASESKSSAGDKHETGRAMLQLEMEKAGQQLKYVNEMKEVLSKIKLSKKSGYAGLGSLVITDKATYFLAVSLGIVSIADSEYVVVSLKSPIGKQLLDKKVGDILAFNGARILEIN